MEEMNIKKTIEQFRNSIFKQIYHRTLLQYTGNPFIHEKHLFFILLPFLNGEKWDDQLNEGALSVGIIHVSLSEHEKIDEIDATSKSQQLTVLSGDYYSGKYYELLSSSGNIHLIFQMAKAVIVRCEHQMKIYEPNILAVEEWFETLKTIETELIESFYKAYNFTEYVQVMKNALYIRRLREELQNLKQGNDSIIVKKMNEANEKEQKESLEKIIQIEIDTLMNRLNSIVHASNLRDELKQYILNQVA